MKAMKKYMGGGKLARNAAGKLTRRSEAQAEKAAKSMAKADKLQAKSQTKAEGKGAGLQNLKNKINAERAAKRADVGRAQQARSDRSAKAAKFASKRADIGAANKANRGAKAEIRNRYR